MELLRHNNFKVLFAKPAEIVIIDSIKMVNSTVSKMTGTYRFGYPLDQSNDRVTTHPTKLPNVVAISGMSARTL